MKFNIFTTLEKDNKELIHSAFLKFLIEENDLFIKEFLKSESFINPKITLEKSYKSTKKGKNIRLDIEIKNDNRLIVIENKFKSFPNENQLIEYDKVLKKQFSNFQTEKFLLCFDKNLFKKTNWIVKDYSDLLIFLEEYINEISDIEKKLFVTHYYLFLKDYRDNYIKYMKNGNLVFSDQKNNDNKFWIKLFYSNLEIKISEYFKNKEIEVSVYVGTGNSSIPLLNIIPKHWNKGKELLIQIQNGEFKFYAHTRDKEFLRGLIKYSEEIMNIDYLDFKSISNKNEKSAFIFKFPFQKHLGDDEFSVDRVLKLIILFYEKVDNKIINNYFF